MVNARRLHRSCAFALGVFVALHLANHLAILFGASAHVAVMEVLRSVYRHPFVEGPLLALFALQTGIGLRLILKRGWPRGAMARLQVISGAALALFLTQHIGAALMTRMFQPEVDTNVYWAAAVVSTPAFAAYFAPYYIVGVTSVFAHPAAVIGRRRPWMAAGLCALGLALGALIVAGLMGAVTPIELPAEHQAYIDDYWW